MENSSVIPVKHRVASIAGAVAYLAGVVALAVFAVMLWRSYCEGFGCMGKGIAWMAWVAVYALLLVLGFVLRSAGRGAMQRAVRHGLVLQLAAGVALFAWWAWRVAP